MTQFNKVVDVPVIMRVEVPHIQFIADVVDIPARNRDRSRLLGYVAMFMAVAGVFGGSDAFFALLRVIPELSASFWSPRW